MTAALLLLLASVTADTSQTARAVEDCVHAGLPGPSSVYTVVFRATDPMGAVAHMRATVYRQRSEAGLTQLLTRVSDPPGLRGAGLLVVEHAAGTDRLLHLPGLPRIRHVAPNSVSAGFLGTDFSYEQLGRVQGLRESRETRRLEDGVLYGQRMLVIEARPGPGASSRLDRIVTFIDPETCIALLSEFYGPGDRLRKTLTIDPTQMTLEGDAWVPRYMRMLDLVEGSMTEIVVETIEVGTAIPSLTFSRDALAVQGR